MTMRFGAFTLLLIACAGCGGGDDGPEADPAAELIADFDGRVEAAGDPKSLLATTTWGWEKLAAEPDHPGAALLSGKLATVALRIGSEFQTVADGVARGNAPDRMTRLAEWANTAADVETASGTPARLSLGKQLTSAANTLSAGVLRVQPDRDDLRTRLGWQAVDADALEAHEAAYWSTDDQDAEITKMVARIKKDGTKSSSGKVWVEPGWSQSSELETLISDLTEKQAAWKTATSDTFGAKAIAKVQATIKGLEDSLESTAYVWKPFIHKPFIILVEQDRGWTEENVALEKATALLEVHRTFYELYGKSLELTEMTEPAPVVVFRQRDGYKRYAGKSGLGAGADGHFSNLTSTLYIHDRSDNGTTIHEGTHLLVAANTRRPGGKHWVDTYLTKAYWFSEGIAEYFGASHRYLDPETKEWRYEIGLLQVGRLGEWRRMKDKAYSLWDLIGLTRLDREKNKASGNEDLNLFAYSQGWFLCYFLQNFNVDPEGYVVFDKGKYRDQWAEYIRCEITKGESGRDVLLRCLGISGKDDPKFKTLETEFHAYFEWLHRKINLRSVKEKRLLPWTEVVKGQKWEDKLIDDDK